MTLRDFLGVERGAQAMLARQLGITQPYLSQIITGVRQPSSDIAIAIERETGGAVTVEELRPDIDWQVIRGKPAKEQAA